MDNKMCFFVRPIDVSLLDPLLLQVTLLVLLPLLLLQRLLPGLSMDGVKDVCIYIYPGRDAVRSPFFHVSENAVFLLHPVRSFVFIYLLWYY